MEPKLTIFELATHLKLQVLAGKEGLTREITSEMIDKPGIELMGFFDYFSPHRILLIGSKENAFLKTFSIEDQIKKINDLFKLNPPALCFSKNVKVEPYFLTIANSYNIPVLQSLLESVPLTSVMYSFLHEKLSKSLVVHGVLLSIHGIGVLLIGKSGIGKSEVALELIKRGHILVSDDRVDLYELSIGNIVGKTTELLKGLIEVRGVGIIDIVRMFGATSYIESGSVNLVICLETLQPTKVYDRMGLEEDTMVYFNTSLPKITIPVSSGRSIANLIETAALNQKLKDMGYNAAKVLMDNIEKNILEKTNKGKKENE
ncbi:MAG: HPr(Ser) kinase/phosphatase [Acholeplasmatales bacterium]|jgi:HPr kinase/phosphorylase|nr:HPr(Ser) kinase/phosphatase [Acholeplasmatales bacterium]